MAKGNAERLDGVLELARARRQNGMMTIEHTQGGRVEEGEVLFQTGQPIHARVGHLVGQDALNWLMKWRSITYTIGTDASLQSVATTTANISNAPTPGIEWLVPQKRGIEREVLGLPLTRRQRFVYFLVDGHRTVADLARCTGKNTQEIELILSELREQGLVAV